MPKRPGDIGVWPVRMAFTKSAHWFLRGSLGSIFGLMMSPSRTSSLNSPYESAIASPT
jgi:hypothetical protein